MDDGRHPALSEIRERTYKPVDAWWTVILVDPLASRLVRLVAPYRWLTPNALTLIATVLGAGAVAGFARGDQRGLIAGALLFHLSFVVDCMDGKIARLNGTGTVFGQWLDFVLDRVRVFFCALALFGGQYARHHDVDYLWLMAVAIFLDLIRYLNGGQVEKVRRGMAEELDALGLSVEPREEPRSWKERAGARLRRNRIRPHLFSGIEYEMFVYIVGPLTGMIFQLTVFSGAAMLLFEGFLIIRLHQATSAFPARLAAARERRESEHLVAGPFPG